MNKIITCFLILLISPLFPVAQGVSIYTASRETGIIYTPIGDSGTWVTAWRAQANPNNNRSFPVPIGFSFNYLGNNFAEVSVSTNGFIDFSANPAAGDQDKPYGFDNNAFSLPSPDGTLFAIAPFYDDLMVTWEYSLENSVKYVTSGLPGDRVFTIEWVHFSIDQSNQDHVNFQVKLYEATSKIEFVYGSMNASFITPGYTCGINASAMSVPPTAAQLLTQQVANSNVFGSTPRNNLTAIPESFSKITLTGCLLPGAAGTIDGPFHVCLPTNGIIFSIPPIPAATGYIWNLPPGFTIVSGNNSFFITVNVSANAGQGNITVAGINSCGTGASSTKEVTVSTRPNPTITGPEMVCSGPLEYGFTTQPSMSNYQWTVSPSGTITSGSGTSSITVAWNTSGTDTVRVNYNDINGCPARSPGSQIVTVNPMAVPVIAGPDQVCINSQGNIYTTESGMTNYIWTVSGGGSVTGGGTSGSNSVTVTWNTAGAQTVSASYTDMNGCSAITPTSFPVTVSPLPIPAISGPQSTCIGSTGNVYSTQPGMINYNWMVSAGGTITSGGTVTSNTVTVTWTNSGPNSVSLNYSTPAGCSAIQSTIYNVTVGERPVPTLTGPANACPGSANNVYTTQSGMNSYTWIVSSGGTITAGGTPASNIAVVTWNTSGPQTISVNYTNIQGCSALTSTTYAVYVELLPVPLISGPDTVCENTPENLYSTETGMSNYIWNVSSGGIITGGGTISNPNVTIHWITPGPQSIQVNYTNSTGCQTVSPGVLNVMIDTLPTPAITGPDSVCVATSGNFYWTQPGMTSYDWVVPTGGQIVGGAGTPVIEVFWDTGGLHTVDVTYTDVEGCSPAVPSIYNVQVLTRPVPTITGPEMTCVGSSGYLYSTEPGRINYQWNISTGGTITGGFGTANITVTWNSSGPQTIGVEYASAFGCMSVTPTVKTVTVNQLPVPAIIGNITPCVNSGNYPYTTEPGMTGYVWTISQGGIITSGEGTSTVVVNWIGTGAQWIKVNYTSPSGCAGLNPGNLNVTVKPIPGLAGTITGATQVCAGSSNVPYTVDSIPNASSYVWNLPPGSSIGSGSGTRSVTIDFSPGATSGNMTVFGYNGCAGGPPSTPLSIMVAGLPSTAGQVVGPDTIARGATGIGYAVPTVVNATGYEWMIPPGVVITSGLNTNSILVDFTGSALTGTISVYGTNDCGFGAVSPLFPVTVADPPSPPFIFLVADSLISNYSEGNQWFLDGNPIPGAMGKVYHATQSGWYWATVTRYGVQSDTSNNIQLTMTGLGEPEEGTVTVYPVPNNGEFTISTGSSLLLPCTLEIYNQLGTKVYEWKDGSGNGNREKTIQLKNMPGGVYTLIFRNLQKQFVRRIVITR